MPSASYVQTSFQGGEASTAFAERLDDEKLYRSALAVCLNYVPSPEGNLRSRAGFKRCGNTKFNETAVKLHSFRFSAEEPYTACFTEMNIRLLALGLPVFDGVQDIFTGVGNGLITSVTGDPPVFLFTSNVPLAWEEGDSVYVCPNLAAGTSGIPNYAAVMNAAPQLWNVEFVLSDLNRTAKTCTLTDAVTGVPLTGAITLPSGNVKLVRILDIAAPYPTVDNIRKVEHTSQVVTTDPNTNAITVSAPDQRVTFFHPLVSPQSFSYAQSIQPSSDDTSFRTNQNLALVPEQFLDGPYLDSGGIGTPLVVDGTTGEITVTLHQWSEDIRYMAGDLALDYTQDPTGDPYYYLSLVNDNVGNALPVTTGTGAVDANWLQLNIQRNKWSSATTYFLGQAASIAAQGTFGYAANALPIYYSKIDTNTNHPPATNPIDWSTTPPAYNALSAYHKAAVVTQGGKTYVASAAVLAGTLPPADPWVHMPISYEDAAFAITDVVDGWLGGPIFHVDDAGGGTSTIGSQYDLDNPGRVFRLKWAPQPWNNKTTYNTDDLATYNNVIYKSLSDINVGLVPDQDATDWEPQSDTIRWTWGYIVDASSHMFQATIKLIGPDLPSDGAVWEFRFGVFSDTTGWPTCGGFNEGRLWLGGATPNRLDAGQPNRGFSFAPTSPEGQTADQNAISYTFNSKLRETILAIAPIAEGVHVCTDAREWLVAASVLNDPITPTSIQAHSTTTWAAYPSEPTEVPTGLIVVQRGGRRVMESRNFIDTASYQSRMNALDLTLRAQHLTLGGVGQVSYQSLGQPVLWVCPQDLTSVRFAPASTGVCPIQITPPAVVTQEPETADLFGIAYLRVPDAQYEAPFSVEHGLTYAGLPIIVKNTAVSPYYLKTHENLYMAFEDYNGYGYVDMLMPFPESKVISPDNPLQVKTDVSDSGTVFSYGARDSDFMLDSGVTPWGARVSDDGLSVVFYGVYPHAGATVIFTCMGREIASVLVAADGTATVPFNTTFTLGLLYQSLNHQPAWLPGVNSLENNPTGKNALQPKAYFCRFMFDPNGQSIPSGTTPVLFEGIFCQFGYRYRRRGKMLRPITGGANGPAFAKVTQIARAGISVDSAQEVWAGTAFDALVPVKLTRNGEKDKRALAANEFVTGRVRGFIKDSNTFNGQICWEMTRAVAGDVLAVGGFEAVEDV